MGLISNLIKKLQSSKLKDHKIKDVDVYRLRYYYSGVFRTRGANIEDIKNYAFHKFKLPKGMSRDEAFTTISYLINQVESELNLSENSLRVIKEVDKLIETIGFEILRRDDYKNIEVNDMFTVDGDRKEFKKTKYYKNYFNWYKEDVAKEEVEEIYNKLGLNFNYDKIDEYLEYRKDTINLY